MNIEEPIKKREYETVLPMINIVFLLLIFFMLAGAFTKPEIFKVTIPNAEVNTEADPKKMTVVVNEKKQYAIEQQVYSEFELLALIEKEVGNNQTLSVQLKADQHLRSGDLIDLMESLGATGLDNIRLLTVTDGQ